MIGHEEAAAKRTNHLNGVAHFHIAQIVGAHPLNRLAFVVFGHALHCERNIVVTRTLAIARAGNGVLACMMGLTRRIHAWRHNGHGLTLQHRKGHAAKINHDVMGFVGRTRFIDLEVAHHSGLRGRFRAIQIGVGMGGRPRRQSRSKSRRVKDGFTRNRHCLGGRCFNHGHFGHSLTIDTHALKLSIAQGSWQVIPSELLFGGISLGLWHASPVVDGASGARRYTGHAQIAFVSIDHVVA